MIDIRKSNERGHADHGWLDSRFSFSFADYYDPEHVQFRTLRVVKADRLAVGDGFPNHTHVEQEVVTSVPAGCIAQRELLGSGQCVPWGRADTISV